MSVLVIHCFIWPHLKSRKTSSLCQSITERRAVIILSALSALALFFVFYFLHVLESSVSYANCLKTSRRVGCFPSSVAVKLFAQGVEPAPRCVYSAQ